MIAERWALISRLGIAARGRRLVLLALLLPAVAVITAWLLLPGANLLYLSFTENVGYLRTETRLSFGSYVAAITNHVYRANVATSMAMGLATGLICTIAAYPAAYYLVFRTKRRNVLLFLILVSTFSSYLVRLYAWRTILGRDGVINSALMSVGIIDSPILALLFTKWAVLIGFVSIYLPLAILVVTVSMQNVSRSLLENARDLGAGAVRTFTRVLLPLTITGAISAFAFTFILTASDYVVPQLLGGEGFQTGASLIALQFLKLGNFPVGAAISFLMLTLFVGMFLLLTRLERFKGI
jgi:spermidine/putrescine transport system permease protein